MLSEYDGNGDLDYNYVYSLGKKLLNKNASGTVNFMYTDYLGSVRVVSDPTTWYRNYYPFGEEYEALGTGNEYKFTGKEWDEESDLYYSWHRYYSREIGRFTQVDPLWMKSPTLSSYHYCQNNPLMNVDPDGQIDIGTVVGGVSGGIYGFSRSMELVGRDLSTTQNIMKVAASTIAGVGAGAIAGTLSPNGVMAPALAAGVTEAAVMYICTGSFGDGGSIGIAAATTGAGAGVIKAVPIISKYLMPNVAIALEGVAQDLIGKALKEESDKQEKETKKQDIKKAPDKPDNNDQTKIIRL